MAFIDEFAAELIHTVSLAPLLTRDDYGKPATWGTAVSHKCRWVKKAMRVSSARGESLGHDVVASGFVRMDGNVVPTSVDDKLTLPDGTTPLIQNWDGAPDEKGDISTKIYYGNV